MKIITRDWIREDAIFYADIPIKEYTKKDLCEYTNYWKKKFVDSGAKKGDKVGLGINPAVIHYQALMLAIYELGLKLVVLHRPNNKKECSTPKSNAHLPLDFYICFSYVTNPVFGVAIAHYMANSNHVWSYSVEEWQNTHHNFKLEQDVVGILAEPQDEFLLCNSSGTTSNPKLINHTHDYVYSLCDWNWKELEFNDNDIVLHLSSINHGASLGVFNFPALRVAKKHFFNINLPHSDVFTVLMPENPEDSNYYDDVVSSCQLYGVTKILCANGAYIDNLIKAIERSSVGLPDTTIIVLCFINPRWSVVIKKNKLKSITSPYGCSEACGPIFMIKMEQKDIDNFDPKFLGKDTKGFYDTKVIDGNLKVNLPVYNKTIDMEDVLRKTDIGYYFVGKNRLKKINDIDINPIDIVEIVEKYISRYKFEVVIDEIHNELYIITDEPSYMRNEIFEAVSDFYNRNIQLTDIIFEPYLNRATVANKADKNKLNEFVERYRQEKE